MLLELKTEEQVGGVVCCTEEFELDAAWGALKSADWAHHGIEFHHTPMKDFTGSTSQRSIAEAVHFIDRITAEGKTCYVHCKAGRTRSATVAICYLMQKYDHSPEEAMNMLTLKRPQVLLREMHWRSVREFRKRIDEGRRVEEKQNGKIPS